MPTADGFIRSLGGGNKFNATFIIDDIQYHFTGNFNPAVNQFTSTGATLDFADIGLLTTQHTFQGAVGPTTISINIQNGPTISAPLDAPISAASSVSGTGSWSQN
ncbi:hypothetical protein SAMD00023353_5900510 [Rosellinia necatrix]|uniref:Uncharacterized protein n=1 Tax=Rosellinia necatrix TaxID=77044 RepID=A0A1W2TX05_ROSNE|nr:hypothetical protein SAMD00023353_5900510 [Rosellinia necatrix]